MGELVKRLQRLSDDSHSAYASISLGPGIHLRHIVGPQGGHRWEFVSVSRQGKATCYELPDLGGLYVLQGDRGGHRLDQLACSIGPELRAVLLMTIAVARDPDSFYGINSLEWRRAAASGESGWVRIMENLARLHGRTVGRARLLMTEKDWIAVYRVLSVHPELRKVLVGLASAPMHGARLTMWLPVNLVNRLQGEADERNIAPNQVLVDALQDRYLSA